MLRFGTVMMSALSADQSGKEAAAQLRSSQRSIAEDRLLPTPSAHHSLTLQLGKDSHLFILQINLERKLLRNSGPAKGLVQQGVVAVAMAPSGDIIAGGGDGSVLVLKHDQEGQDARFLNKLPTLASIKLGSHISTLREDPARSNARSVSLVCGTRQCDTYRVTYELQVHNLQFQCLGILMLCSGLWRAGCTHKLP